MEKQFDVGTTREGSDATSADTETTITKMGCTVLTQRVEGTVTAIAEKKKGVITRSELSWANQSSDAFKKWLDADANVLLQQITDTVKGNGGDNGELRVKVRGKM